MNKIYCLIAVDGTNSEDWARSDYRNSFVHQFYWDVDIKAEYKVYSQGPNTLGTDCDDILMGVYNWLYEIKRRNIGKVITTIFVGHSRGGHIAVNLAFEIRKLGLMADQMYLYDAVDRDLSINNMGSKTVSNTRVVYHAIRHPDIKSRTWFGNCALYPDNIIKKKHFYTTHGGMGGDYIYDTDFSNIPLSADTGHFCDIKTKGVSVNNLLGCINESLRVDEWIRNQAKSEGLLFPKNSLKSGQILKNHIIKQKRDFEKLIYERDLIYKLLGW